MTSRYNVYFYSRESLNEGIDKLEKAHQDDYTKLLPIYIYGTNESAKTINPEMDRTIKKASTCITRHAIKERKTKIEIPGAVRWIDNAWMALGKAHFYKREFFSGIETFEYVARTYKSKERYEAWIWLLKSYNEMGLLSQSEPYTSLIKNEKRFPKEFKDEYSALMAEFYIKQGLYEESIQSLSKAISLTKNKKTKARLYFILGQLHEQAGDNSKAIFDYNRSLHLKPAYDMIFNAKIKKALLTEYTASTALKIKSELLKMTKDIKNDDYLDVIYFTLGTLEEREQNTDKAYSYYKLSVANSQNNNLQKSKSYLRLAEINFENEVYTASEAYYDSTVNLLKEDFPGYKDIVAKKKSLNTLIGHIRTIKNEDSLQRVAAMDSNQRNVFIAKLIKAVEEEEQKKKEEKELQQNNEMLSNNGNQQVQNLPGNNTGGGKWYFYNQQTKSFGISDFIKKWGNNRKNEDNWRRQNKQQIIDPFANTDTASTDTVKDSKTKVIIAGSNDIKSKEYYLKNLPLSPSLVDSSNKKILDSYYALGSIYREQLNNTKKSVETFNTMNTRFPSNKYEPSSYYQMYRIFLAAKDQPRADACKKFLNEKYPTSDYAKIINDPDFAKAASAKKSEVEAYYSATYDLYVSNNCEEVILRSTDALRKFGRNDFSPKFAFIRAMCIAKTQPLDSAERALRLVVTQFNKDPVYQPAKAMLDLIEKNKTGNALVTDTITKAETKKTYVQKDSSDHYWVISLPIGKGDINTLKTHISDFNTKYYSVNSLTINTIVLSDKNLILVKTLKGKQESISYHNLINSRPEVFESIDKSLTQSFSITFENMQMLLKEKNQAEYFQFFADKYLGIKN